MKETRYFQYLSGENKGNVVTLSYIDVDEDNNVAYYIFDDESIVAEEFVAPISNSVKEITGKVVVEISSADNKWTFEEIQPVKMDLGGGNFVVGASHEDYVHAEGVGQNVTLQESANGKTRPIPPKELVIGVPLPNHEDFAPPTQNVINETKHAEVLNAADKSEQHDKDESNDKQSVVVQKVQSEMKPVQQEVKLTNDIKITQSHMLTEDNDPVSILVDKAKKTVYKLPLTIDITLPDKGLYQIVSSQFDDGSTKFINRIVENIDVSDIIKSIGIALKESYESVG